MNLFSALHCLRCLVALAIFFQGAEILALRKMHAAHGPWSWKLVRQDFLSFPKILRFLDFIFKDSVFLSLLGLELFVSVLLLFWPSWIFAALLFLITWLCSIRFRGAVNGGADSMSLIALLSLSVGLAVPKNPKFAQVALLYLAVNVLLSYLIAAVAKMKNSKWRSGSALKQYFCESSYDVPLFYKKMSQSPSLAALLSWAVILFELGFASLFFFRQAAPLLLLMGILFHFMNDKIFGLNRFFWIWIATYPAVLYLTQNLMKH